MLSWCTSKFVKEHNQNNEQQHRRDAPKTLVASRNLRAGDTVHRFLSNSVTDASSHWTLQLDELRHINLSSHVMRFINHSCEPNSVMRGLTVEAWRDIPAGEELTLDYNSSEYKLVGGTFRCTCGSPGCVGEVRGWVHLTDQQRDARRGRCQPWLTAAVR